MFLFTYKWYTKIKESKRKGKKVLSKQAIFPNKSLATDFQWSMEQTLCQLAQRVRLMSKRTIQIYGTDSMNLSRKLLLEFARAPEPFNSESLIFIKLAETKFATDHSSRPRRKEPARIVVRLKILNCYNGLVW